MLKNRNVFRIGYEEQTDVLVLSPITKEWEPAMSKTSLLWRYTVIVLIMLALVSSQHYNFSCIAFQALFQMFFVLFFVVTSIIINKLIAKFVLKYVHFEMLLRHKRFLLSCVGSFIQVLFIMVIDKVRLFCNRFLFL